MNFSESVKLCFRIVGAPYSNSTVTSGMGNSRSSLQLQPEDIEAIQEETGFNNNQIDRLYSRFSSLDKQDKGYLSREDFLRIPELAISPLGDRIVHAFFNKSRSGDNEDEVDLKDEDKVDFKAFVRILAHFRPIDKSAEKNKLNTRMKKLQFAFRMYDLDGDGKITKKELKTVLTLMVGSNISEKQLDSIAERTIMEATLDNDDLMSFEEFAKVLERTEVEKKMSIRFLN